MSGRATPSRCWALAGAGSLLLAGLAVAEPAPPQVVRRPYTMRRQLPYGFVTTIAPAGRQVWFGGFPLRPGEEHGLGCYDKQTGNWRLLLESEGVIADEISVVAVDGDHLWIGSTSDLHWNRGLHRYDTTTRTTRRYLPADGLPHWRVRALAVRDREVWAATMGGVARFCKESESWEAFTSRDGSLANDFTVSIAADDEFVWVGSFAGLEQLDRRSGRWRSHDSRNSLFPTAVTAIGLDGDSVWFISTPQVVRFQRSTGRFALFPIQHPPARQTVLHNLAVTADKLFFGSRDGLHEYDRQSQTWRSYGEGDGLLHRQVQTLAADEDLVWCVDDLGRGISVLDRHTRRWRHYSYRAGSPSNHLSALLLVGDELFVGTLGSGFWKYHPRGDRWTNLNLTLAADGRLFHYRGDKSATMHSDIRQLIWHDQRVWLATNHGLCVHQPDAAADFEVLSPSSFPMLAVAAWRGLLLCGGQQDGLRAYDPGRRSWTDLGPATGLAGRISALASDGQVAYVAAARQLYRLDDAESAARPVADGLSGDIQALLLEPGHLWIGTTDGLWHHTPGADGVRRIAVEALPDPVVHAIARCRGRLWVGTEDGLASCVDPEGEWQTLGAPAVLPQPLVAAVVGDADYLWVATMGGGLVRLAGPDTLHVASETLP